MDASIQIISFMANQLVNLRNYFYKFQLPKVSLHNLLLERCVEYLWTCENRNYSKVDSQHERLSKQPKPKAVSISWFRDRHNNNYEESNQRFPNLCDISLFYDLDHLVCFCNQNLREASLRGPW